MTSTAMSYDEFINLTVLATHDHDHHHDWTQGRSAGAWKQHHHDLLTQRELT